MKTIIFILALFISVTARAQDLTGIWRGSFSSADRLSEMFNIEDRYKLEVQVDQNAKKLNSVTYSYKTTVFYGKATADGVVNTATGKVRIQELRMVEVKMMQNSVACLMTYTLQYTKNGDEEILEGRYTSFNEIDSSSCGRGTVFLRKVPTSDFYKEPFLVKKEKEKSSRKPEITQQKKAVSPPVAKNTPKTVPKSPAKPITRPPVTPKKPLPAPKPLINEPLAEIPKSDTAKREITIGKRPDMPTVPRVLASRENELVKTIIVKSNEVTLNIYDNGTIDHDTISVYLDNKLVISKQMLTASPITMKLRLNNENDYHELVMVAENLGDFPPNTSLMVVKAGDKEYEVRITSTEQKNAVVIFKYEKP
jgi:hypothetical protein